jgi:thiamine-phosphate pyrophosphorylase
VDPTTTRIIDANLNRAREGLRVLEEHVRLVLGDAAATERIKGLRHALVEAAEAFGVEQLLAARDIQGDVGTGITSDAERDRGDAWEVAAAAAKRSAEALRCIEEYGKIANQDAAARVKQLRYELYAVEQDALGGGRLRQRLRAALLHVLVTEALCSGPWLGVCEQAIAGGADVLQLREKTLNDRELLRRARQLREFTRRRGVLLIINDRPDIARLAEADGVHVGQDDLAVSEARHIAGRCTLVGKSTHTVEQAGSTLAERPDYIAVGPMFASPTKPQMQVAGPPLLAEVSALTDLPVVAIGGINGDNLRSLKAGRLFQAAVCQGVVSSPDPAAAARTLRELLSQAPARS